MGNERIRVDRVGAVKDIQEVLMGEDRSTWWLRSQLAWLNPGCRRVRGESGLEAGDLVVEQKFVEFLDELVLYDFGKSHESGLWSGVMLR
jgi:hypothetical protein